MQTNLFCLMAGVMLLLFLGAGCFAPSDLAERERQENPPELVRLEQTESSFTVVVERGDAHVTIDVQRTGPRVEGFIRDPEIDSPFESNATIRNRKGFPFIRSYGGDIPFNLMETENMSLDFPKNANQQEQIADLQLAADAAQMLRDNPDIGERFRWELREVYYMAQGALESANDVLDGTIVPLNR